MSSMKLMLVTLLDNLEEFLSRLSLLAVLVLQYLNWNSGQDGYCACHVPRPLQVGLSIFQVLAVAITGGVGGSSSSDLLRSASIRIIMLGSKASRTFRGVPGQMPSFV